ncbi:DUF4062 domain-containing protein [Nocardioides mangrovicus]|uniref:DUF4062 domain-containing protein n=1 Tax=Nocardioides mangrovicus TaxID=2478913 RepID=A0A3L8NYS4_9ACTN|nr:DUF4062 domain-containing protein [Nocardioides mangrovicus]RLV47723.1 DUF4062 domain-containing protein [Nocardioides mangrovicus]
MSESLLIDLRSASSDPADADLRAWASGRRVFVSSLIADMPEERAAARQAVESFGAVPVMFEQDLAAQDIRADQAYLAGVRSSDIYLGLFGPRYGVRMSDGYSATHAEFNEAERAGLRLCLFVPAGDISEMDGAQQDLVAGARNLYVTSSRTTPESLQAAIGRRLVSLAAEDIAPWIRLGRTVFRSTQIASNGSEVLVTAEVRSVEVHAELVDMRNDRAGDVPFASPVEAFKVRVADVSTDTFSTQTFHEKLALSGNGSPAVYRGMGINGMSADEIGRRALADGLFGTSTLGAATFGVQAVDPLAPLRGKQLDDSIVRPVARLLITEHLLQTGAARSVTDFTLGPAHSEVRQLRVAWNPPKRYINEDDPEPVAVEGPVRDL